MTEMNIVGNNTASNAAALGNNVQAIRPSTNSSIEPSKALESAIFERLMSNLVPKQLPENQVMSTLLQRQSDFNQHINDATPSSTAQIGDPQKMMAAQLSIMQAVVWVDFTAKMAGSLAQSINRLVNIQ